LLPDAGPQRRRRPLAELGLAGLVLVLVPLGVFTAAALQHALARGARACLWPATYLVFFVASNAGESALLRHKPYWALYVAAACHVARRHSTRALVIRDRRL
jgi:O-antigen ligase